jgi:hypothetical protein
MGLEMLSQVAQSTNCATQWKLQKKGVHHG